MLGNAKALKRNKRECEGFLIGPTKAPCFLESLKLLRGVFFRCASQEVGFEPKYRGTDGKLTVGLPKREHGGKPRLL